MVPYTAQLSVAVAPFNPEVVGYTVDLDEPVDACCLHRPVYGVLLTAYCVPRTVLYPRHQTLRPGLGVIGSEASHCPLRACRCCLCTLLLILPFY